MSVYYLMLIFFFNLGQRSGHGIGCRQSAPGGGDCCWMACCGGRAGQGYVPPGPCCPVRSSDSGRTATWQTGAAGGSSGRDGSHDPQLPRPAIPGNLPQGPAASSSAQWTKSAWEVIRAKSKTRPSQPRGGLQTLWCSSACIKVSDLWNKEEELGCSGWATWLRLGQAAARTLCHASGCQGDAGRGPSCNDQCSCKAHSDGSGVSGKVGRQIPTVHIDASIVSHVNRGSHFFLNIYMTSWWNLSNHALYWLFTMV